jgi:hypothetical protein
MILGSETFAGKFLTCFWLRCQRCALVRYYCWPFGIAAAARSASGTPELGSSAVVVVLSWSAEAQSPAHSFVPRTVPTNLQPAGALGLTCTIGFPPIFGGCVGGAAASCARAVAEMKHKASTTAVFMAYSTTRRTKPIRPLARSRSEILMALRVAASPLMPTRRLKRAITLGVAGPGDTRSEGRNGRASWLFVPRHDISCPMNSRRADRHAYRRRFGLESERSEMTQMC